jgi:hypothetical protein
MRILVMIAFLPLAGCLAEGGPADALSGGEPSMIAWQDFALLADGAGELSFYPPPWTRARTVEITMDAGLATSFVLRGLAECEGNVEGRGLHPIVAPSSAAVECGARLGMNIMLWNATGVGVGRVAVYAVPR